MRIAFYAPLKSPTHSVPSGDRRVGRLLVEALQRAGHQVTLASTLRTLEPLGDAGRQALLRDQGAAEARDLIARWQGCKGASVPDLWFTYHVYYKAPDWIGPLVSEALGIPYVIAEASYAPKRAGGAWAAGHEAVGRAIRAAALVLCPTKDDMGCVQAVASSADKVVWLPPFLDTAPYEAAALDREAHRTRLVAEHDLDPSVPWVAVVAMMRSGDKEASYRMLSKTLGRVADLPWQVVIAGDGPARPGIEKAFAAIVPGRARFLGERGPEDLARIYAACDLCIWPAVNEAYGMAMLEAQAAGLPVISRRVRGVPDVVSHGETGLLAPADDPQAFADLARSLLADPVRRGAMGMAAARKVRGERGLDATAGRLGEAMAMLARVRAGGPAGVRR